MDPLPNNDESDEEEDFVDRVECEFALASVLSSVFTLFCLF